MLHRSVVIDVLGVTYGGNYGCITMLLQVVMRMQQLRIYVYAGSVAYINVKFIGDITTINMYDYR